MSANLHAGMQSAKKVVFSSPGLVDFAVGLASGFCPSLGQVTFLEKITRKFKLQKYSIRYGFSGSLVRGQGYPQH